MKKTNRLILHPFLFAMIPAVFIFSRNAGQMPPSQIVFTLVFLLASTSLLWGLLYLLMRDVHRSALATSIVFILFFSFADFKNSLAMVSKIFHLGILDERTLQMRISNSILAWVWVGIILLLCLLIAKSTRISAKTSRLMSWIGLVALVATNANLLFFSVRANAADNFPERWQASLDQKPALQYKGGELPDIYWIILDAHARDDILAKYYGISNSPFLAGLKERGFYVAQKSTSNYMWTYLSVTSTLNSIYLDDIKEGMLNTPRYWKVIDLATEHSMLFEGLRPLGYKITSFYDPYQMLDLQSADYYFKQNNFSLSEFQSVLFNKTPLVGLHLNISANIQFDQARQSILYIFHTLSQISENPEPTFTLAHVISPHPPFVFDYQGNPVQPDKFLSYQDDDAWYEPQDLDEYISGYAGQIQYIDQLTLDTIDSILESSSTPPIILVTSDHGPASHLDPNSLENTDLDERFSVLNAFYFPDQDYSNLTQDISLVNDWRVVLNQYFGREETLLPVHSYYHLFWNILDFTDITDLLEK